MPLTELQDFTTNTLREALPLLRRAKEIIAPPGRWTQRAIARNRRGEPLLPSARGAYSFCLAGAVVRAEFELHATPVQTLETPEGEPAAISGPKRLESALRLLAWPSLSLFDGLYREELEAEPDEPKSGEPARRLDETLFAAIVNDQEKVIHEHVLFVLALTIVLVRQELRERRRQARGQKRGERG